MSSGAGVFNPRRGGPTVTRPMSYHLRFLSAGFSNPE